jgi:hypothetical protein
MPMVTLGERRAARRHRRNRSILRGARMLHVRRDDEARITSVVFVSAATLSRPTMLSRRGVTVSRDVEDAGRNVLDRLASRQEVRWALNLHTAQP